MVRLPRSERQNETDVSNLRVRTPQGAYVPLSEVAQLSRSGAPTSIKREDGVRAVNVKAELASEVLTAGSNLNTQPHGVSSAGQQVSVAQSQLGWAATRSGKTTGSLGPNYLLALFAIYALLAIPFKSYVQPFIIMSAIPFGFVGAVGGHMLMDTTMSIISMFGIVALTGVVVNDSLVLIDASINIEAQRKFTL